MTPHTLKKKRLKTPGKTKCGSTDGLEAVATLSSESVSG